MKTTSAFLLATVSCALFFSLEIYGNENRNIRRKAGQRTELSSVSSSELRLSSDGKTVLGVRNRNLTNITIPNSVTTIEKTAFYNCYSLTTLTIPDSVTTIRDKAFARCFKLTNVTIPDSVTTIGDGAFFGVRSVKVSAEHPVLMMDAKGALLHKNENRLLYVPIDLNGNYTIPDNVTTIGSDAFFGCRNLTNITIPDSVTTIGRNAFAFCRSLTTLTIPNSVATIESGAFIYCRSLTTLTIPGHFSDSEVKRWRVPDTCKIIRSAAPKGYGTENKNTQRKAGQRTELSSVSSSELRLSSDGKTVLGVRNRNLTNITIPNSVTTIGKKAFYNCRSLTTLTIPDSVTTIGDEAFARCFKLTNVTIPDSVTTIGDRAFAWCSKLTNVTIPDSVTTIGRYMFMLCSSLRSLTLPNSVTTIGDGAISDCYALTSLTIPNSVTTIGDEAFARCYKLTNVTIPDSVTTIGDGAFTGVRSVKVSAEHPVLMLDAKGVLLHKNEKQLLHVPNAFNGNYTIPDNVTTIGTGAFYSCNNLTNITIPDNVTTIGRDAFTGCTKLTNITIPDSVTTIGRNAFALCRSLTALTIPNSVATIGADIFSHCRSLKKLTIPGHFSDSEVKRWSVPDTCKIIHR